MLYYHGTDQSISELKKGSYVTKRLKDAQRFGYRKSCENHSQNVYVYTAIITDDILKRDPSRDRAFILQNDIKVDLLESYTVYSCPEKLSKFKK